MNEITAGIGGYRSTRRQFLIQSAAAAAAAALAGTLRAEASAAKAAIPDDPLYTSATRLAAMIRDKKISAVELTTLYLQRIEAVNPKLNAVVTLCAERALSEARIADEMLAAGKTRGALHGVPCTIKDSLLTEGVRSTGGTLGRKNHVPSSDATVVARLREAGVIVMGKTNTPELTLSGMTTNLIFGKTHNPYKLGYQPGGSTGGGAAMIAAGGTPFDIGTDFGGSIRGPAHFCGITGLKPSTGRVPRTGHIVDYGGYFDAFQVVGPLARWTEDLELILPIIAGPDYQDAAILPMPWSPSSKVDVKALKVAWYVGNGSAKPPTPATEAAVKKTVELFKSLGATVTEDCPKALIRESQELRNALSTADGRAWVKRMLRKYGTEEVSPVISLLDTPRADAAEFTRLAEAMDANRAKFLGWFKNYDLIICPVNGEPAQPWPDNPKALPPQPDNFGYTTTYNNTGWPGVVVRAGSSPEGLPIGVQLIAKPFREDLALAAAAFVEAGTGGYQKPAI
ncbi:amidase [Solimonas aquatica]|uniref:Amidase n=1 Tax=Solimonas aquatica TaxID=489703 RepID=A0A1H8ZUQ8_9GAMM|nr:amidase [Solimonas aquatica]SEP68169.1 amidase [Solimonas aquatica]